MIGAPTVIEIELPIWGRLWRLLRRLPGAIRLLAALTPGWLLALETAVAIGQGVGVYLVPQDMEPRDFLSRRGLPRDALILHGVGPRGEPVRVVLDMREPLAHALQGLGVPPDVQRELIIAYAVARTRAAQAKAAGKTGGPEKWGERRSQ